MTAAAAREAGRRGLAPLAAAAAIAGACWFAAIREMSGMDMGPGGALGSLSFFTATWATMMAAMMLPAVAPALRSIDEHSRDRLASRVLSPLAFGVGYLATWTGVGIAAFLAYRSVRESPPRFLSWDRDGAYVAGAAVVAAGLYELTPLKRRFLARCRARVASAPPGGHLASGLRYATSCVGCSAGLMLVLFAVGVMSVLWMAVVAALVFVQRVPAAGAQLVTPIAVALLGLGAWIALAPASVPGLTLPM